MIACRIAPETGVLKLIGQRLQPFTTVLLATVSRKQNFNLDEIMENRSWFCRHFENRIAQASGAEPNEEGERCPAGIANLVAKSPEALPALLCSGQQVSSLLKRKGATVNISFKRDSFD